MSDTQPISYKDSTIDERIIRAVVEMGFENMTPIQAQAIPVMLSGKDLIGQAQTGTGKTAAFGIPLIQGIDPDNRALQAIALCPTRELHTGGRGNAALCQIHAYIKVPGIWWTGFRQIRIGRRYTDCSGNTGKSYGPYAKTYTKTAHGKTIVLMKLMKC